MIVSTLILIKASTMNPIKYQQFSNKKKTSVRSWSGDYEPYIITWNCR